MLRLTCTRLMLSTPAAMAMVISPAAMRFATIDAALSPEPQYRLTVIPGTASPKPASSAALRAMLWPVAPSGRPQPTTTSSTSVGSMPALDRMTQHVRRHRDAVGLVQRAPNGACDARPAIGDDGDTFMSLPPVRSPYHAAS